MFGKKEEETVSRQSSGKVETIIGKETNVKGSVTGSDVLRIDGKVEGDITTSGDVIVGETGIVQAEVNAKDVTVAGEIHGNTKAEGKLEIISSGKVIGDIKVQNLIIRDGAKFEGKSEMIKEKTANSSNGFADFKVDDEDEN